QKNGPAVREPAGPVIIGGVTRQSEISSRTNLGCHAFRKLRVLIAASLIELRLRQPFGGAQIGALEAGDREVGVREIRAVELGMRQVRPREVRLPERGVREIR